MVVSFLAIAECGDITLDLHVGDGTYEGILVKRARLKYLYPHVSYCSDPIMMEGSLVQYRRIPMQLNFLREIFILVLSDLSQFLETPKSAILEGGPTFQHL